MSFRHHPSPIEVRTVFNFTDQASINALHHDRTRRLELRRHVDQRPARPLLRRRKRQD